MAGRSWLESSLDRSSKLGLEVLERAKRRSVNWKSVRSSNRSSKKEKQSEVQEDLAVRISLDHAFAKIVKCMSETTSQCQNFYRSAGTTELSEREQNHVYRFHSQQLPQISGQPQPASMTSKEAFCTGLSEPEDFLIEVSPGTYAVTAAMQDAGPKTRVVHVNAGESMRLTFNL